MVKLAADIEGIGLLGPGLDGWTGSVAILEGRSPYIPQPTVLPVPDGLPPAERRRLGRVVKLALGVGLQATSKAGVDPVSLPSVFTSSGGDGQNCHEICQALSLEERMISPTRFHNSVHNAAAGYWSIATGSTAASNALCAFDASFAAGLLEAVTQVTVDRTRVLLVAYDAQYPPPLFMKRPIPEAFGVAMVLRPVGAGASATEEPTAVAGSLGRLALSFSDAPADRMSEAAFEDLRASIPAARSLPLLYQLAVRKPAVVNIEYLDGRCIAVEVTPCT
jgi:Beta-ketoacyl synthase, N-terminal domain